MLPVEASKSDQAPLAIAPGALGHDSRLRPLMSPTRMSAFTKVMLLKSSIEAVPAEPGIGLAAALKLTR
jgi:hypothetical protein